MAAEQLLEHMDLQPLAVKHQMAQAISIILPDSTHQLAESSLDHIAGLLERQGNLK